MVRKTQLSAGEIRPGERLCVIYDAGISGGIISEFADYASKYHSATVKAAVVFFDFEEGAADNLKRKGIRYEPLVTRQSVIDGIRDAYEGHFKAKFVEEYDVSLKVLIRPKTERMLAGLFFGRELGIRRTSSKTESKQRDEGRSREWSELCGRTYRENLAQLQKQYGGMIVAISGERVLEGNTNAEMLFEKYEKPGAPIVDLFYVPPAGADSGKDLDLLAPDGLLP